MFGIFELLRALPCWKKKPLFNHFNFFLASILIVLTFSLKFRAAYVVVGHVEGATEQFSREMIGCLLVTCGMQHNQGI